MTRTTHGIHITRACFIGLIAVSVHASDPRPQGAAFDPRRPPAAELEASIADGFTLAAVGDCIISRPLSQKLETDAAFAGVVEILRDADVAFGNLETSILDVRTFEGWPNVGAEDWGLTAHPAVAGDLAEMGFDILSRANNHSLDWGIAGMRETGAWLDRAGIVHAGVGEHRALARAPQYFESPLGRMALVSLATTYHPSGAATPAKGRTAGRPGLNALRTERITLVPPETMRSLAKIEADMAAARGDTPENDEGIPDELTLFGTTFRTGESFAFRYEMNALDLQEILHNVRLAKQHSDFAVVSVHAHQSAFDGDLPGDFLRELAHLAIDAGADAFVTHGIHHLGPIEVYSGRPVFYGLANFFWSDVQEPLDPLLYEEHGKRLGEAFDRPDRATDADLTALLNASSFASDKTFRTVLAVSRFEGGRLDEIRLHPVDLGYGRRLPDSGVPRLAGPEESRAILDRLVEVSAPYGTRIEVQDEVGVIRVN